MSLFKISTAFTALAALTVTAACTSSGNENESSDEAMIAARTGEEVRNVCFASSIDNFSITTKNAVVVSASPREKYLLTTSSCFGLDDAMSIEVENRTGCLSRGDYILAYDTVFGQSNTGMQPSRCVITRINKWKETDAS